MQLYALDWRVEVDNHSVVQVAPVLLGGDDAAAGGHHEAGVGGDLRHARTRLAVSS